MVSEYSCSYIKGRGFRVCEVPKERLGPKLGEAVTEKKEGVVDRSIRIRKCLTGSLRSFVLDHELYHCVDTHTWWGVFGSELRANLYAGLRHPIGCLRFIVLTVCQKDRRQFYIKRLRYRF